MEPITPRVDLAFKKIFGVEENKDLLISLINSIVSEDDQVADLTLLNPYNLQNFREEKLSILDIKARGQNGKYFNIEIQITDEKDYDKRALYYWAKLYTEQLQKREEYKTLSKAIGIHILNFLSIPGTLKYHNTFRISEKDTGLLYFKDLELHTIELQKFSEEACANMSEMALKVKNALDMWVAFLTRHELLERGALSGQLADPVLKKALHVLEVMNLNREEREVYEGHFKWLWSEENALAKAKDDGKEERSYEIAHLMLQAGESFQKVQQFTGLTPQELEKLSA